MSDAEQRDELEEKHRKGIAALLENPTIASAATALGVSERTLYRYLRDPVFDAAYREATRQAMRQASAHLARYAPLAGRTLLELATAKSGNPAVKRAAARDILEIGTKLIEADAIEARFAAIEAQLRQILGADDAER